MTTIAYKDGVLVANSRSYAGSKMPLGRKSKIHRLADGSLFGCSSSKVGQPEKFRRLVEEFGVEHTFEKEVLAQAIVIKPNGDVFYFNDEDAFSGPIETDCLAIGSGEEYAIGAMLHGATAQEAIVIAAECDVWTGGELETLILNDN